MTLDVEYSALRYSIIDPESTRVHRVTVAVLRRAMRIVVAYQNVTRSSIMGECRVSAGTVTQVQVDARAT